MFEQKVIEKEKDVQFKSQFSQSIVTLVLCQNISNTSRIILNACEKNFQINDNNPCQSQLKEKQIDLMNFQKTIRITIRKLKQIISEYCLFSFQLQYNIQNINQKTINQQNNEKREKLIRVVKIFSQSQLGDYKREEEIKNKSLKRIVLQHKILNINWKQKSLQENKKEEKQNCDNGRQTNKQKMQIFMEDKFDNQNRFEKDNDQGIEINSQNSYLNIKSCANTLKSLNRFEEALQFYDYAIQKNPENYSAFVNKANTINSLNRFEEAFHQKLQIFNKRQQLTNQ